MKTIKFKNSKHFIILALLLLEFVPGYAQDEIPPSRTPYPIIFVHGLVGDKYAWTDDESYDIIDFLKAGDTPLRNQQILDITLDKIRSTTTLSNTKEEDVELFTKNPAPSDLYIINFNVHSNNTDAKSCIGQVWLNSPILATDTKIPVVDEEIFQIGDIIRIQNEFMQVTSTSANIITVKRNILGTEAKLHILPNIIYNLSNESNQAAIAKQGYGLKLAIDAVIKANEDQGVKKVILVGHSMGGLAIREYIRSYYRHDVAKVVTIGSPHYGSNLSDVPVQYLADTDGMSDAVRDLRSTIKVYPIPGVNLYPIEKPGIYLEGGNEKDISLSLYYSKDVNLNGSESDNIKGLNDFNWAPLPEDISKVWIASNRYIPGTLPFLFDFHDGVVKTKNQWIYREDTLMVKNPHNSSVIKVLDPLNLLNEIRETRNIFALIRGLDEPDKPELAYGIGEKSVNKGFITYQQGLIPNDVDLYKVVLSKDGKLTVKISANELSGITLFQILDEDLHSKALETNINNTIDFETQAGTFYIRIYGTATNQSWQNPYTFQTNFVEPTQSALVTNPKNLIEYYDVVINEFRDKNITLSNTGTTTISVSELALSGIDAEQFVIVNPEPFDLVPAQNKTITVRFNPTLSGEKNATLTITNSSTETPVKSISLNGTGVDSPTKRLVLNPDFSYNYGNVTITKTKNKTFTFQNRGSNTLTVTGLSLSGLSSGEYSIVEQPVIPFDLQTGEVKQAVIKFSPSIVGVKTADFVITNNSDNGSPEYPVVLFGNGTNNIYTGIYNTITAYEYWFDDNYNSKKDTSFAPQQVLSLNTSISAEGLNFGLHRFHLRVKDTKGRWSAIAGEFFHKLPALPVGDRVITACEYWFDDDFANKVTAEITPGQTITTNTGFDVSELQTGLHSYHVRYKDDAGQWSSVVSEFFHKLPVIAAGTREITACEYWFDNDFANKVSTEITPGQTITTNEGFDVSSLTTGLHSYHVRYKDDAGQWSSVVSEFFHKLPVTNAGTRTITACEYWFDDDYGNKISVDVTPGQTITTNSGFDVSTLQIGLHSYHVRYKDDAGHWSSVVSEFFHKLPALPEGDRKITACEYWFDDDFANKVSTEITPGQTITTNSGFDVSLLTNGLHSYHVRYKDDAGRWSSVVSEFFHKLPSLPEGNRVITACEYWFDDDYTNKVSTEITPGQTITTNEGFDVSSLTTGLHSYHVRYKDDAGQWSSVVSEFFHKLPMSSAQDNLITAYRYWFNSDEENIQLINLATPVNPYELIRDISVSGLPSGDNTIHFQFRDTRQVWSSVVTDTFNMESLLVQEIALKTGWNIFSVGLQTQNSKLDVVSQKLITNGSLVKIQDEGGNSFEDWGVFGNWKNNIGDISVTEGYKLKVNRNDTLEVSGTPVKYPYPIPLKAGWNMAGYPHQTGFSGMNLIQQLADKGTLIKVQDEGGNSIEDWGIFGSWKNNIGNFMPGEGYTIKVSADDTLWIYESYPKSSTILPEIVATSHFIPAFSGNGVDHMNFNLVGLPIQILKAGDELAIFDGATCVGAVTLMPHHLQSQTASIVASATDYQGTPGFAEGNPFVLKLWNSKNYQEFKLEPEILKGTSTFIRNETTVASLEKYATTGLDGLFASEQPEINCYPNPFNDEITVEINLFDDTEVHIEVLNQLGQQVKYLATGEQLNRGVHRLIWDGTNAGNSRVAPGIYLIRMKINNAIYYRKVVYSK